MKIFRAIPGPAKASFLIAAVAAGLAGVLGITAEVVNAPAPTVSAADRGGPGFVVAGLIVVMLLVAAPPMLVGAFLSRESAGARRFGALLAALVGVIGLALAVRGPVPIHFHGSATAAIVAIRVALGLAAGGVCAIAYFGLRAAGELRIDRGPAPPPALPGHQTHV